MPKFAAVSQRNLQRNGCIFVKCLFSSVGHASLAQLARARDL